MEFIKKYRDDGEKAWISDWPQSEWQNERKDLLKYSEGNVTGLGLCAAWGTGSLICPDDVTQGV